jgi:type I restriction enzyme M protein
MVLKKKDGKDQEVQEGWIGHVIPFELVQATILIEETSALRGKEEKLSDIQASYEEIIDSLSEEEKDDVLNDAKDAFSSGDLNDKIKELFGSLANAKAAAAEYGEDSFERKLVQVRQLMDDEKELKAQIKKDAAALHLKTKETIENLTDEQVTELLEEKWISPLCSALRKIPDAIISDFVSRIRDLSDKYAVTYATVAGQIAETKSSLAALIDGLTGDEYDMKGLSEFQKLLEEGGNE